MICMSLWGRMYVFIMKNEILSMWSRIHSWFAFVSFIYTPRANEWNSTSVFPEGTNNHGRFPNEWIINDFFDFKPVEATAFSSGPQDNIRMLVRVEISLFRHSCLEQMIIFYFSSVTDRKWIWSSVLPIPARVLIFIAAFSSVRWFILAHPHDFTSTVLRHTQQ